MDERHIMAKRTARSGQVDYADSITLVDNRKRIVELVSYYIHHNTRKDGLCVKLVQSTPWYVKHHGEHVYMGKEQNTEINLDEAATLKLIAAVPQLAALADVVPGRYLILDLEGQSNVEDVDAGKAAKALLNALAKPGVATQLQHVDLETGMVDVLRSVIRIREIESAISELEAMLDQGLNQEGAYQAWCKKHSWAFGTAYQEADKVRTIAVGDQVDFLLPLMSGYRDIIELKRPDMTVLGWDKEHRNHYFVREVSEAIGQCHRYLDVAEKGLDLQDEPETAKYTYHPRATIVIGRSNDWTDSQNRALQGLNSRLNGIAVMTYDQLLAQARRLLEVLTKEPDEARGVPEVVRRAP